MNNINIIRHELKEDDITVRFSVKQEDGIWTWNFDAWLPIHSRTFFTIGGNEFIVRFNYGNIPYDLEQKANDLFYKLLGQLKKDSKKRLQVVSTLNSQVAKIWKTL